MNLKIISSFIIGLLTTNSFAQKFAVINDADGFVNVRNEAKVGNNSSYKLNNNHLVFYFDEDIEGNWQYITYEVNQKEHVGYVYKNRLKEVATFTSVPVFKETKSELIFKNNTLELQIKVKPFAKNNSKITYLKNTKIVEKINSEKAWGIDGDLPKTQYDFIILKCNNKEYVLPNKAFENLYEPNLEFTKVYVDEKSNSVYIEANNGDGAGGYIFIMVIQNGVYKERLVLHPF